MYKNIGILVEQHKLQMGARKQNKAITKFRVYKGEVHEKVTTACCLNSKLRCQCEDP